MRTLVLNGYSLSLKVDDGKLIVRNGFNSEREKAERICLAQA